jgi:hypothetical protein
MNPISFLGKIKKWRESTTTSPSRRHLGRYKSLFAPGSYIQEPEENGQGAFEIFESKQADISALILRLINFCIESGYVLDRWKHIVNTMIFKDTGNYKIHRLRVIHIYEADFNLLLPVKWRELLHAADRRGTINPGQYGGQPGHEASSLALLEKLCIDLSYLQEARYKLRTAAGISEREYSHSTQFPLYGSGQGSGNSPALWLFISATLFDVHDRFAHGATFQDPSGAILVQLKLSGFVDDTNASLNDWQPQHQADLSTLLTQITHDAQTWNDLLFISGGHHLSTVVPHLCQWITSSRTPCLRREAYISPIAPFVIYHWNAGCYWLCNPLDPSHASFSLTEPSNWQPNAA